jgi:hypothetical protein
MIRSLIYARTGRLRITTIPIIAFLIAALGMIPLMGLPGALAMVVGDFFLEWTIGFFGYQSIFNLPRPDTWSWPAAILATWIWPIGLVIGYFVGFRIRHRRDLAAWVILGAILLVWCMLLTIWLYSHVLGSLEMIDGSVAQ